jgi:hypothetical protein
MALTEYLILRKPRSGCLEERTALIQPIVNSFTRPKAGFYIFPELTGFRLCAWPLLGPAKSGTDGLRPE